MLKKINYLKCIPGGNDTALVLGDNYLEDEMKIINDEIMNLDSTIEQVGFLSKTVNKLTMAGGEFCGNATRSAAYIYSKGLENTIDIEVSQGSIIQAGVTKENDAWCTIPLLPHDDISKIITAIEDDIYMVKMKGMTTIVVGLQATKNYSLKEVDLKESTKKFIDDLELTTSPAVGVMYLENTNDNLCIHPIVWVNSINTLFYETGCGSGTTAVAIVEAFKKRESLSIDVIQPSKRIISAIIEYNGSVISNARISGNIDIDNITYDIEIDF